MLREAILLLIKVTCRHEQNQQRPEKINKTGSGRYKKLTSACRFRRYNLKMTMAKRYRLLAKRGLIG